MMRTNKKIKNGKERDATSLKDFLKKLPGGFETRKAILLLVLYYLPLDSQAKVLISGVLMNEDCLDITNFVLEEKNKQVGEFRNMATTYIRNCNKNNEISNVYENTNAPVDIVTPVCPGTPFTVACKNGDLNMVRTLLKYWRLWGEALGVELESSTALVNMAEMPFKTCMDVITYNLPLGVEHDLNILHPSRNQLAGIVRNGDDINPNNNALQQTALYKTVDVIVSGEILADCFDTYSEIVQLLLKKGAFVTDIFIDSLCFVNNLQPAHRTRLISIFLPYLKDHLKESLLFKLMKINFDMDDIQKILSENPLLHTSMFSEHLSVLEELLSGGVRFPKLLNLFKVLLEYQNWDYNPLETIMPNRFNHETHPMTLVDVFYVVFGSWTEPYQEMYLKVLHPVILNMTFNDNTYLHFILNEEKQWREGGHQIIEKRKKALLMNIKIKQKEFLEQELERVKTEIESMRRASDVKVFNMFEKEERHMMDPSVEFEVKMDQLEAQDEARKEILKMENHFRFVIVRFEKKEVGWYDLFGELFLHRRIPYWKRNKLLKNFFTTNIKTRSCYGVKCEVKK